MSVSQERINSIQVGKLNVFFGIFYGSRYNATNFMELMLSLNSRDTQDYGNIVGLIFKVYFLPFSS